MHTSYAYMHKKAVCIHAYMHETLETCTSLVPICIRLLHFPVSGMSCACIMDVSLLSHLRSWMKHIKCADSCFDMTLHLGEYPVNGTCTFGTWAFGTWTAR